MFAVAGLAALGFKNACAEDWAPLWSTATLPSAVGATAATSAGNEVFFTNGSNVDIYNTSTGIWSTANLSQARAGLAATSVGNQVFFAGGQSGTYTASNVVDIYNTSTNTWSTANLSQARGAFGHVGG